MKTVPAKELQVGDYVDLEGCPYVNADDHPSVLFELAAVTGVEQETEACTAVTFEGLDTFGLPSNYRLLTRRTYGWRPTKKETA